LFEQGKLVKILLFPIELGGQDRQENSIYVPAGIPAIKDQLTGSLMRFLEQGLINKLEVKPEYKGNSFVPAKIRMKAWHTEKAGGFEPVIDIW
jgi:hypothetical protein